MKKAIIFYQSKTGTTKNYAQEINAYLLSKQIETLWLNVEEYNDKFIENMDYLILGCWTKGLMVILQKPDEVWSDFVNKLSIPKNTKVALFATYKIRTGSMFKNMKKQFKEFNNIFIPNLKSRNGKLSEKDKIILNELVN